LGEPGPNPFSWQKKKWSRLVHLLFPTTKDILGHEWEMVPQCLLGRFFSEKGHKPPPVYVEKYKFFHWSWDE
jgi:hypothetical protein